MNSLTDLLRGLEDQESPHWKNGGNEIWADELMFVKDFVGVKSYRSAKYNCIPQQAEMVTFERYGLRDREAFALIRKAAVC